MLHPTNEELYYAIFNAEVGWVGILGSARGLLNVSPPQPSAGEARRLLGDRLNRATPSPGFFQDLIKRLTIYFQGQKTAFPDELDLASATPFQREVWRATRLIPYGETRSYTWVAEQIGKPRAARAAGQALSRNPLPIVIPCHRVLTISGGLGGYRGGMEMKRYLLRLEASASSK